MQLLEFGKDNYWTGDEMVGGSYPTNFLSTYAFPGCEALFAFENASNHCAFASDILLVSRMHRNPGSTPFRLGWKPQAMVFSDNHPVPKLRGQAKGIEQVLRERGLWRDCRSDGFAFLLQRPVSDNRTGCDSIVEGGRCTRSLLAGQPDFLTQKGRLEEETQARGHSVIFFIQTSTVN